MMGINLVPSFRGTDSAGMRVKLEGPARIVFKAPPSPSNAGILNPESPREPM